jgi:hypothetical protein
MVFPVWMLTFAMPLFQTVIVRPCTVMVYSPVRRPMQVSSVKILLASNQKFMTLLRGDSRKEDT